MQRTLKRESKVLEIVKRETIEAFHEEKDTFHGRRERTSLRSGAPRRRPVRDLRRRGVGRAFLFYREGRRRLLASNSSAGAGASVARAGQRRSGRGETASGRVARGFGLASVQPGETARLRLPTEEEP
jgi:hypothetical protein